jgi:hypothetical protein
MRPKLYPVTIDPEAFVARMEERWIGFGNVVSESLRSSWRQLCEAFNDAILNHYDQSVCRKWFVVQLPTGTGKTLGLTLYCGILSAIPFEGHPGVIIFTRFKADADLIAQEINKLSGMPMAASFHSDTDIDVTALQTYPVLVATHSRYRRLADTKRDGLGIWHQIGFWSGGERRLVVMDEAIDFIDERAVGINGLRRTLEAVRELENEFPAQIAYVSAMIRDLESSVTGDSEAMLLDGPAMVFSGIPDSFRPGIHKLVIRVERPQDLQPFIQAFRNISFDKQNGLNDAREKERLRRLHEARMESLEMISQNFMLKARVDGERSILASKALLAKFIRSAVIMDATAAANPVCDLIDEVMILPGVEGCRSYANVILHVSRGNRVGKHFMRQNAKTLCESLVADLNVKLPGRKVLVVTHIELEAPLLRYDTRFEIHTTHWGNVVGRNDWRECDTVVIYGLPYPPPIRSAAKYMAIKGPQDSDWLKDPKRRAYGRHEDIRRAIEIGGIVVDVVQAINRVRCRCVIDKLGNCEPTDIFLWLPSGKHGDQILSGIVEQMPRLRVEEFSSSSNYKKPKRSRSELALITHAQNMPEGRQRKIDVQRVIGASQTTMKTLIGAMQDVESEISRAMNKAGVRYETSREGRSKVGYFVKECGSS